MGDVKGRTSYTVKGTHAFSSWNDVSGKYSALQINTGYNPLSLLEIVSTLNFLNLGDLMYEYCVGNRPKKYNPKLYFNAVQTIGENWNQDYDNRKGELAGREKSGSC